MELTLGAKVKIKQNGLEGVVKGVWTEEEGPTKYDVRYVDSTGCLQGEWLTALEIEVVAADEQASDEPAGEPAA